MRPSIAESRVSSSSNRSREADFEAALLNAKTIFLSSTSLTIDEGEPTYPSRDEDAPDPIEKRSFEQDYDQKLRTPTKNNFASPSIIPPTPSTPGTDGPSRASISTTDSQGRRISRIKPLKAVDMHGEFQGLETRADLQMKQCKRIRLCRKRNARFFNHDHLVRRLRLI